MFSMKLVASGKYETILDGQVVSVSKDYMRGIRIIASKTGIQQSLVKAAIEHDCVAAVSGSTVVKPIVKESEIRVWLKEKVAETVNIANKLYGINMSTPSVEFYRKGTCAGKAYYSQHKVMFNEVLAVENKSTFIETVKHEVAHLVAVKRFGDNARGHGNTFKSTLIQLGGTGERCHKYDCSSVKIKRTKYVYSCTCGRKYAVGGKRHNKQQDYQKHGMSFYRCKCGGNISFVGTTVA